MIIYHSKEEAERRIEVLREKVGIWPGMVALKGGGWRLTHDVAEPLSTLDPHGNPREPW
jgi:hypothetical protein